MTAALAHRGPDDSGFYSGPLATLGHRRLSIIDPASGRQPLANRSGTLQLVYNGEIYNHARLRPLLERAGHTYHSHCDTETVLHAWEEWGPDCLAHFRGMFALAVWDSETGTLFCARDRLGKKPLYYFWDGALFAFASEIKALLEHPAITAGFNEAALPEYLAFGYISGPDTMFSGIRKLLPGHHLTLNLRTNEPKLSIRQYWDPPQAQPDRTAKPASLIQETRRRLDETVQLRLMSDVPLGLFLSGGVDSSAIAALAARHIEGPLQTFSVGYDEAPYSELGYAAQVASHLGTRHRETRVSMSDFFRVLPHLVWHEDEPIAWPSSVSLYFLSKFAREHVKVVLTGEGSDEIFGGYERYRWNLLNARALPLYSRVPDFLRRAVRDWVRNSSLLNAGLRRKLGHTVFAREGATESLYLDNFYSAFGASDQANLLLPHLASRSGASPYASYLHAFNAHPGDSPLARMLYADQKTYLLELLMKQDQMSMAASIESRVPLLDHELVEFAATIPDEQKIHRGIQKYVFKKAVEDLLPRDIVYRKKMGFPTPLRAWLRAETAQPLYRDLLDRSGFLASFLDLNAVEAMVSNHLSGKNDATDRIWRLINLQIWGGVFLGARKSSGSAQTPELATTCLSKSLRNHLE